MSNSHQGPLNSPDKSQASDNLVRQSVGLLERPTMVRFGIVSIATLAAVMLYLDRASIGVVLTSIKAELQLKPSQSNWIASGFFLTYALAQVPGGWLSDRFGPRRMLALYVLGWSVCTILTGLVTSFALLLTVRLMFGITQAGAFPASSALLSKWAPVSARGIASSIVALGGRLGGAVAPILTAFLTVTIGGSLYFTEWQTEYPILSPWRVILVLYGVCGLIVAVSCIVWLRNRPSEHPYCNSAEQALIDEGRPPVAKHSPVKLPVVPMLTSLSLWMMCLAQFTTNVGWAFLINGFPDYLKSVKGVSETDAGTMATVAWTTGIVGLFLGGIITDVASKYLGLRWGRTLPMALTRFVAAASYLICLEIDSPWGQTATIAVMAFATDLGIGATWAFAQDVGGRSAGAILGWGNMWGNFGAFAQTFLITFVLGLGRTEGAEDNWTAAFYLLTIAFVISGVASLFINAAVPLSSHDE